MAEGSRRRVSYAQLDTLWEFLNSHRDIATGFNKSARARDTSKRMWQTIAEAMNAHGDGASKDWKGWSKYWNDYKSKLKKTVATIRASHQRTGGGPSDAPSLSEVEQKFLQILGDSFGSGLPGVRVEPFNQEPQEIVVEIANSLVGRNIILENVYESSPQPGPSRLTSTPLPPPRTPIQSPQRTFYIPTPESRIRSQHGTPRRSPRQRSQTQSQRMQTAATTAQRRRQRRREPPMSQEEARRKLIDVAAERRGLEDARNGILQQLVDEIRQVKELLRERLPVPVLPETPDLNLP